MVLRVLASLLLPLLDNSAQAQGLHRYRCVPSDDSPSYTTAGSCRGEVLRREPLTRDEIAALWEIENRGRPFTRCTAIDRRYSFFVKEDEACPAATDKRTVEYARKSIEQQQYDQKLIDAAVASLEPPRAQISSDANPPAADPALPASEATAPVAEPIPTVAPPALPAAPVPVEQPRTRSWSKWVFAALAVVLGIWGLIRWRSGAARGSEIRQATGRQRSRPGQASAATRVNPAPDSPLAMGRDMNQMAQQWLAALETSSVPADLPGGWAFSDDLRQAQLDYSVQSLDRVDQLLARIKGRSGPQRSAWPDPTAAENFCLLLAFYLGAVISQQSGRTIQWYTREQAAPLMPSDMPLPDERWSRLVGVIAESPCVPLGVIEAALFGSGAPTITCKAYVERFLGRLGLAPAPQDDENQRCARLLQAFFSDAPIHGGLAFRHELKQAQLDHSLASLQRLDELLRRLQAGIKLPADQFINDSRSQNFMRLAAFYIGMTVAKLGAMPVKWLNFAQAKQMLADLDPGFETSLVCVLGGRCYFPLGLVTEVLLEPNARRNLPDWARQALQLAPPPPPSILRSSLQDPEAAALDGALQAAIRKAGFMAAWGMFMVEGGANGTPTVFAPGPDGSGTFRDFGFYGEADAAFEAAEHLMEQNPDRLPYQVMSFDGYANLHTGRTDALTIELRVYAGISAPNQAEFRMSVACPYRNANDPAGFAIYSPKLMQCSMDDSAYAAIFKAFYEGVASYQAGSFDWFQRLDERI